MTSAAERNAARWELETIRKRLKTAEEFSAFLETLPASWGKNLKIAQPEDVIVFSKTVWRHQHQGSWLPDGSKVAFPSGHNSMLSMLSTTFCLLGRTGKWDPDRQQGNPMESFQITEHRAAYRADLIKRGYRGGSAIPLTEESHRALLTALYKEATAATSVLQMLSFASTTLACSYMAANVARRLVCWSCKTLP